MKRFMYFLMLGVLLLSLGSGNAFGQATASAALEGTVQDISQAAVVSAQVTLTSKDTGAVRTVSSGSTGLYRFDLLPPGNYEIKVSMRGFKTATAASVELLVGKTSTFNFTLQPGDVSETVTVTEQVPIM